MHQENRERKMRRDFARIVIRSRMYYSLSHACITSHLSCRHIKLTLAHIQAVGAHVRRHISRRVVAYAVKSRACTRANSLPPALFGTAKRRRIERISYCRMQSAVPHSPSPRLVPFRMGPLFLIHPSFCPSSLVSHSSLFSSFALESFLSHFLPPSPLLAPTADTGRAYACVHVVLLYLLYVLRFTTDIRVLLRAVAYRRPSAPIFALESYLVRFLSGNFRKNALPSDAIYACHFLPVSSSRT